MSMIPGAVGSPSQFPYGLVGALATDPIGAYNGIIGSALAFNGTNPEPGGSSPFQMTTSHRRVQVLTPTSAITIKLPAACTAGDVWTFVNLSSSFAITINGSSSGTKVVLTKGSVTLIAKTATPTTAADWEFETVRPYFPSMSRFHATKTAVTTTGVLSSYTSERFDTDGNFDITTGVFTAPHAGVYLFVVEFHPVNGNNYPISVSVDLEKNAVAQDGLTFIADGAGGSLGLQPRRFPYSRPIPLELAAGDLVRLNVTTYTWSAGGSGNFVLFGMHLG